MQQLYSQASIRPEAPWRAFVEARFRLLNAFLDYRRLCLRTPGRSTPSSPSAADRQDGATLDKAFAKLSLALDAVTIPVGVRLIFIIHESLVARSFLCARSIGLRCREKTSAQTRRTASSSRFCRTWRSDSAHSHSALAARQSGTLLSRQRRLKFAQCLSVSNSSRRRKSLLIAFPQNSRTKELAVGPFLRVVLNLSSPVLIGAQPCRDALFREGVTTRLSSLAGASRRST